MNRASRWPPSVVTSSPTTTSDAQAPVAAIARAATAASIRSWSLIAMTSRSVCVLDVVEDRRSRSPSRRRRRCGCAGRPGRAASVRSAIGGLQVRPDREEDGPPLFGRRGRPFARRLRRAPSSSRSRARAACPSAGTGTASQAAPVARPPAPPDAGDVERRAALDGEQGRPEGQGGRRSEQLDRQTAAGQVAIADEARRRSRRRRAPSSSRRASRRPTIRTPAAPRVRTKKAWSSASLDGLHRARRRRRRATRGRAPAARSHRSGGRRR